jgi:hypothetical protein
VYQLFVMTEFLHARHVHRGSLLGGNDNLAMVLKLLSDGHRLTTVVFDDFPNGTSEPW